MKEAKYKVGDVVSCFREETDTLSGFDFTGEVLWVNLVDTDYEYKVSNAPELWEGFPVYIWESEMKQC